MASLVFKRKSLYSNVSHRSLRFVSIEAERAQDEASSFIFEMANLIKVKSSDDFRGYNPV